jgi:hypothetical protein
MALLYHKQLEQVCSLGHHEWIAFDGGAYAFRHAAPYWCDLHVFEAQLHAARALLRAGLPPAERARAVACLLGGSLNFGVYVL